MRKGKATPRASESESTPAGRAARISVALTIALLAYASMAGPARAGDAGGASPTPAAGSARADTAAATTPERSTAIIIFDAGLAAEPDAAVEETIGAGIDPASPVDEGVSEGSGALPPASPPVDPPAPMTSDAGAAQSTGMDAGEPGAAAEENVSMLDRVRQALDTEGARTALQALLGLLLFLLVWPLARLLAAGAYWVTSRVLRDPKLTSLLGIEVPVPSDTPARVAAGDRTPAPFHASIAQVASRVVFVLVMAAGLLAGLHVSGLTAVSEPLDRFARAASYGLPLVGRALVILAISYVAARLLRTGVTSGLNGLAVDQRLRTLSRRAGRADTAPVADPARANEASATRSFSEQVGQVTYWLVLAFGLAATVEALEFVPLSQPLRDALDRVIALLPALGAALLIVAGGYLLARLTRKVVTSLLEASGFDRLVRRIDIGRVLDRIHPSAAVGFAAMLFVLVEATIAALNQLGLVGMSAPLTAAVTQVGAALPHAGLAIVIMGLGHFGGRFVRAWLERTADDLRLDALLARVGVLKPVADAEAPSVASRTLGHVAYWVVMLLAAQQAFDASGLTVWAGYVSAGLAFGFQKLGVGGVIVLVGLAVANQARDRVLARRPAGADASRWIAGVIRVLILVFAFTMAIQHVGVADRFVMLSFAFAFGGLCLALALAFGLGSRELIADALRERLGRRDAAGPDDGEGS